MTAITESFALEKDLTFTGNYGYRIQQDRVIINLDQITSQRDLLNLSGTLALELRAYQADGSTAVLASTVIGQLSGQHFLANCQYDLVFQAPPAGQWQIALELREWDGEHYALVERQWFDQPYTLTSELKNTDDAIVSKEDNVIVADFTPAGDSVTSAAEEPASSSDEPIDKAAPKKTKKSSKVEKVLLSVNHSSLEELSDIKGLPKKVAKEIVEKRPHSSWEGLLKLKGMGPKLLKKLSKVLKLN
ncbi:Helix-hairpin-helix motif protein [Marinomonas aquimarina]|uniref:Helix-hairpin-helix motif protein n=1 Tax=Marinomonas aquimarina TaxID=295068 RepID=A0A1A8TGI3_9GAMM|nr:helix-hairpin-helix domain-containing protein [Marinomonas aquimarina]SBS31090.1 Helix-hairpin-helix motif protein [Marinomonas aquimarina]